MLILFSSLSGSPKNGEFGIFESPYLFIWIAEKWGVGKLLFRKKENTCEVVASDLEVQLSSSLILEKESDFSQDITIPGRKLFDISKGLPDNSILEIDIVEEGKLQIKSKKSKFILSALDAKTFPLMDIDNESSVVLSKYKIAIK